MEGKNFYKLSKSGPDIDNILYKASKAITTDSAQASLLSDDEKTQARLNIYAANESSLLASVSSLWSGISSNSSSISLLESEMSTLNSSISSFSEKVAHAEKWDTLLSQTTTDSAVPLVLELMDYGNLSMYITDTYSSLASYYPGDFCKYNDRVYECISSVAQSAWNSNNWYMIYPVSDTPPSDYMDGGYTFDWLNPYTLDGGVVSGWPSSYEMNGGDIVPWSTSTTQNGGTE